MINLFDLSAQMAGTKLLTDKAHRDGSPIRRKSDAKRDRDPSPIRVDDKVTSSELTRNSSKKMNTNGTPMKTLLAKEMSKETEPKRKQTSVIAKLMGLDDTDLSTNQPVNPSSIIRRNSTDNFDKSHGSNRKNPPARNKHFARHSFDEIIEYKDVYEVQDPRLKNRRIFEDQRLQSGRMLFEDQRLQSGRMLFEDQRLQSGRMFEDQGRIFGDQRLQSGRMFEGKQDKRLDLVREKFMEAKRLATDERLLNSQEFQDALEILSSNQDLFLKFLEEPNSIFSSGPQTKRITVLKPLKSTENNNNNKNINSKSNLKQIKREKPLRSKSISQPTRIVVLKPSPVKIGEGHIGNFDNRHRRDESLISSICSNGSNGYGGDESSLYDNGSNGSIIEEDGIGGFSYSEITSPISYNSRDYIAKFGSPFSTSYSPESSVIKEAKKRLSERWATVSDEIGTVPVPASISVPRSSSTLGEMLSIQELKKAGETGQVEEREGSFMGLARSKSVPVSSSLFDNLKSNSNSSSNWSSNLSSNMEVGKASSSNSKGKSSFKGKVSNFFFSRSKKSEKEKACTDLKPPSQHSDEISSSDTNNLEIPVDNTSKSTILSSKGNLSIENPNSSMYSNEIFEKPKPSPTSVFELPFEDTTFTDTESSHISSITNQQPPLSRSSAIESIARTLSWDENCFESPTNPQIKEKENYNFVQKLISSSGFEIQNNHNVIARFHSLDSALDPLLLDEFLDRKTEEAKCRERRSNQRLLFDCVNSALLQIGHSSLRNSYPWGLRQDSVFILKDEVWRLVRDWVSRERKVVHEERENANMVVERIVKGDLDGREWDEQRWHERNDISREIGSFVLDELVEETFDDLAVSCLWPRSGLCV